MPAFNSFAFKYKKRPVVESTGWKMKMFDDSSRTDATQETWINDNMAGHAVKTAKFCDYSNFLTQAGKDKIATGGGGITTAEYLTEDYYSYTNLTNWVKGRTTTADRYVLFDIENVHYKYLKDYTVGEANFKISERIFIDALDAMRTGNPTMKYGIYGLPFQCYSTTQITDRFTPSNKYNAILEHADFISNALYIQVCDEETGSSFGQSGDLRTSEMIKKNLDMALKCKAEALAVNPDIELWPLVWHKVHPLPEGDPYRSFILQDYKMAMWCKLCYDHQYTHTDGSVHKIDGLIYWDSASGNGLGAMPNADGDPWYTPYPTNRTDYRKVVVKIWEAVANKLNGIT